MGAFSTSLRDKREVWTATSISGSPNGGRAADLAIFRRIWTYCSRRLDLHAIGGLMLALVVAAAVVSQ
jgi:hypothetical protein